MSGGSFQGKRPATYSTFAHAHMDVLNEIHTLYEIFFRCGFQAFCPLILMVGSFDLIPSQRRYLPGTFNGVNNGNTYTLQTYILLEWEQSTQSLVNVLMTDLLTLSNCTVCAYYTLACIRAHAHMRTRAHAHAHARTRTHAHTRTRTRKRTGIRTHTQRLTHKHTLTPTHTRARTHTHARSLASLSRS